MTDLAHRLFVLSRRIKALEPDRTDPEKFHADKSECADEAKKIGQQIEEQRT